MKSKIFYRFVKRSFDITASFLGILILGIPMLIVAIAVKCSSKGPVLFRQKRFGKDNRPFTVLKFRSMYVEAPADLPPSALKNADAMITRVGKLIRRTSLDELPQLFNILAGQMSVIGPRPAQVVNEEELVALRNLNGASKIRPGLTGWAQVNGRDVLAADVVKKAELDGWYAAHCGFRLDLKIFFLTVGKVLRGSDIVEGDSVKAVSDTIAESVNFGADTASPSEVFDTKSGTWLRAEEQEPVSEAAAAEEVRLRRKGA